MGELFFEEKTIVVPGDKLANGMDYLPAGGAFRDGENIFSSVIGVLNNNGRVLKVIPLKSKYTPKPGDMVIAKVAEMTNSIWFVNIGGPNDGIMSVRDVPEYVGQGDDLSQYYNYGEYVVGKVVEATRKNFNITLKAPGTRRLSGGRLIKIDSAKVPRVIGKQGSMISLVKDKTGCRIMVGQNGLVWIQGSPDRELVAVEAVNLINEKGHVSGLTEVVSEFLDDKMKNVSDDESEETAHAVKKDNKETKKEKKEENDEEEKPTRKAYNRKNSKRGGKK
jgi:exosome complex component RRP4